ncbi:MAG: hypothetical protein KGS61_01255 [Verrucomicrobia bacterium]|nr:hypothetical protein [Verrucomicrobiota bacterium]
MNSYYFNRWLDLSCRGARLAGRWGGLLGLLASLQAALAADFTILSPGYYYSINGQSPNPTLTLVRGRTYTLAISTSAIHPFEILGGGTNVINNNISSGTITFNVPTNAANYSYICSIHGFGAKILTVPPPPPPTVQILNLSMGTNLVLTSTGTNTWGVFPEYSTNLSSTNWFALTVQTNQYANGTNETFCGRPIGNPLYIRIRAQQN